MWYECVDPSYQHMVKYPFLEPGPFGPAIGTEKLTHATTSFNWVEVSHASAKCCKHPEEELTVPSGLMNGFIQPLAFPRGQLMHHNVDTGHIGVRHSAKNMP